MKEIQKDGAVGRASERAGMDRKTGRKYASLGKFPSELGASRTYRTRADPIEEADWAWVEEQLRAAPALEAKTLFEMLQERRPGAYGDGQVRTLQRRVRRWRATSGPGPVV